MEFRIKTDREIERDCPKSLRCEPRLLEMRLKKGADLRFLDEYATSCPRIEVNNKTLMTASRISFAQREDDGSLFIILRNVSNRYCLGTELL
jgi:hypothetical protein